jgi:hypothetical protein
MMEYPGIGNVFRIGPKGLSDVQMSLAGEISQLPSVRES